MADKHKPVEWWSEIPEAVPVIEDAGEIRSQLLTVIAYAMNQPDDPVEIEIPNVSFTDASGVAYDVGDWKITVARVS